VHRVRIAVQDIQEALGRLFIQGGGLAWNPTDRGKLRSYLQQRALVAGVIAEVLCCQDGTLGDLNPPDHHRCLGFTDKR